MYQQSSWKTQYLWIAVLCLWFMEVTFMQAAELFVSPEGNDNNPGTKEQPFASIQGAQKAVRALTKKGLDQDVKVVVSGGTYRIEEALVFGPSDGGTDKHSVTYAAAEGETPVISGGRRLSGWKPLVKEPDNLAPRASGKIWFADIPEVAEGSFHFRELFVNGKRRTRARTPDHGYFRIEKADPDDRTGFTYKKGELSSVKQIDHLELVFLHDWSTTITTVKEIDENRQHVLLKHQIGCRQAHYRMTHFEKHPRYRMENAMEYLDSPGEWFLDRKAGRLYYYPTDQESMHHADTVVPVAKQLVRIEGTAGNRVKRLRFQKLAFFHCAFQLPETGYQGVQAAYYDDEIYKTTKSKTDRTPVPSSVDMTFAEQCEFEKCRFAHLGGSGIMLRRGSHRNKVLGSEFTDISANGIIIGNGSEVRDRLSDTPPWETDTEVIVSNNLVSDNRVHNCGRQFLGSVGIYAGITANTVIRRNEVSHLPYTGISSGWMWNPSPTPCRDIVIEHNHIHHVMRQLSDGGGIYTLGRQTDSVIRNNYIHNIPANTGRAESNGMFFDQGSSQFSIENNMIHGIGRSVLRFHQAERLTVKGNTLLVAQGQKPYMYNRTDPNTVTFVDNTVIELNKGKSSARTSTDGKSGRALVCDGADSYVEIPHARSLEPETLTLEAWIFIDEYPASKDKRRWIASKNANEWVNGHYGLLIAGEEAAAYLNIGGKKENSHGAFSRTAPLKTGQWQHLAMTYDGKSLRVYCDGKMVAEKELNRKRTSGKGAFAIGRRPDGHVAFNGKIDEVRLYSQALSAETIANHAASAEFEPGPSLVRHWGFEFDTELSDIIKQSQQNTGPRKGYREWFEKNR